MSTDTLSPDDLQEPEFLERARELDQLRKVYATAQKGRKRCVTLIGAEGIGKTRLFETFRREINEAKEPVFVTDFAEEGPPLQARAILLLMSQIYRHYGPLPATVTESERSLEGVDLGTMQFVISKYSRNTSEDVLAQIHGSGETFWSAMTQFVVEHSRVHPVTLLLENVHAMDVASQEFVEFFFRVPEAKNAQLFVCLTYAGDEKTGMNPFQKIHPKVKKADFYEKIEVMPLLSRSVPSFLTSAVGRLSAGDTVFDEAYKLSRGNPGLLLAFLRSLAEKGKIVRKGSGWHIDAAGAEISALPREMEEKLIAAVSKQGKKHRDGLEWAAVIGEPFTLGLLGTLTGIAPNHMGFVVTDHTRERYWDEIEDADPKRYKFASPDVRQAVYDGIKEKARRKMHLAIAKEFERRDPPPAAQLAHHYRLGDNVKKEYQWALEATTCAYRRADWSDALTQIERVHAILADQKKPSPQDQAEAFYWLARVCCAQRELARADEAIKAGLRLAGQLKSPELAELLRRESAFVWYRKREYDKSFELVKAIYDAGGPVAELPELLIVLADLYRLKNRPSRSLELLEEVDKEHIEFEVSEGWFALMIGRLKILIGDWAGAERMLERAEEVLREQKAFGALAQTLYVLAEHKEIRGQIYEALALVESAMQYAEKYNSPTIEARLWCITSRLMQKLGLGEEGQRALAKAKKRAKRSGRERIQAYVLLEMARWSVHIKNMGNGIAAGRKALEIFERLPERWGGAACYHTLARLYLRQRDLKAAGKYFKFAMKYYNELGANWQGAFLAPQWASVYNKLGKIEARDRLLDEGLAAAEKYDLAEAKALILIEKARLSGEQEQAVEWFGDSYRLLKESGNKLEAARALRLYKRERTNTELWDEEASASAEG